MIISYNTAYSNFTLNNGFGRAGWGIVNALKELGHKVYFNTPLALVEFTFAQPDYFTPKDNQYQIILCPWESTELPEGWVEKFNSADEVWATSDWVADVYRAAGVNNVKTVYPHGIEKMYKPRLKRRSGPLKYYIQGAPASRKGTQEGFEAFREAFKDDSSKATLTIKAYQRSHVRWYQNGVVQSPDKLPNVSVITKPMETDELVRFTDGFDVNIYPSYGEGWGFIPMESLAQGTPTICTESWCHYHKYLNDLGVKSELVQSPWPDEHPGKVYKPDFEDLVDKIKLSYDDFENQALKAFKNSFEMHEEYDWLCLTREAFQHIVDDPRFS